MKLELSLNTEINYGLIKQTLEDFHEYIKRHVIDAETKLVRNKLIFLHQLLPKGEHKKKIRGALNFINRWERTRTWLQIVIVLRKIMQELEIESLDAMEIIKTERFVRPVTVLKLLENKDTENQGPMSQIGIKYYEVKRNKKLKAKKENKILKIKMQNV